MAKVLITGGSGFIGRYVCGEMLDAGCDVVVLDSLVEQVHGASSEAPPVGVEFIEGDVRDKALVTRALAGVDIVIHLAAEVGVGQSMYEIARYVGGNDLGTAVLLEAMIGQPIRRIVVASSMSVYGEGLYRSVAGDAVRAARRDAARVRDGQWDLVDQQGAPLTPIPTSEDKPVDLASIYALTKYMQERAVLIFGAAYGVEAVALRLFNVFGPGQALSNPYTGVLANFASRLASGQPPLVFEDGRQKRDFVHVRDVARAFRLAALQPGVNGECLNIGSGRAYAIADVAAMLARAMDVDLAPDILRKARAGDIRNCFGDISRAQAILGFEPQSRLEDTLHEIAEWAPRQTVVDRAPEMRRQLEERGLVS